MDRRIVRQLCCVIPPLFLASCGGSAGTSNGESEPVQNVELFSDFMDDERETVMITPAVDSAIAYEISPAAFDTVIVRPIPVDDDQRHWVEALLKGSFPEGCTELHRLTQTETADGQSVTLTMRRPQSAICTQVVRPYRFFFELERRFPPGSYTLVVNDRVFPFTVE